MYDITSSEEESDDDDSDSDEEVDHQKKVTVVSKKLEQQAVAQKKWQKEEVRLDLLLKDVIDNHSNTYLKSTVTFYLLTHKAKYYAYLTKFLGRVLGGGGLGRERC
jgi:predicted transcriptional regulator